MVSRFFARSATSPTSAPAARKRPKLPRNVHGTKPDTLPSINAIIRLGFRPFSTSRHAYLNHWNKARKNDLVRSFLVKCCACFLNMKQPKAGLPVLGSFRSGKSRHSFREFDDIGRFPVGLRVLALLVDLDCWQEEPTRFRDHSSRSISPRPRR